MNSPSLSAVCVTGGRVQHLEEAIACFNSQQCQWPIELLIYNTCPEQKLSLPPEFQRENIRIINCQTRPGSLGESRNLAITAASGTHICTWDDDDLYLPNHLQNFINHFADNHWCWMSAQFYSLGWQIKSITGGGQNVVAFTKAAWEKVERYAALNCGEDRDFVGRLTSKCKGVKIELQPGEISFIYSWDNACYHVSGAGDDAGQKNNAWKRAEHDFLTRVKLGKAKTGPITLQPHLKHDYQRMATEFVSKLSAMNTPNPVQNAVSRAPEGAPRLFHAVERHQERISVNIARKQHAWTSWQRLYDREGVIPKHYWKYERSAKDIGDTLDLPYFKDVLKFGMEPASDNDIIVWTNDDTILHPSIVPVLREHLAKYPVVMMARCEFRHPPARNSTPELWAKADRDRNHNGRDLMAFRKSWLTEHWDEIPDFLLGASEFDVFMTVLIRHFYRISTPRHSLNETKFPAELPRGHVGHLKHSTQWNTLRRYANAPAQKHNIRLYSENASRYLTAKPTIVLEQFRRPVAAINSKLDLRKVTLWACWWSHNEDYLKRTVRVLEHCQRLANFERVILFSCMDIPAPPGIELVRIPTFSGVPEWNEFVNRKVPAHIKSDLAMAVHEDGFPIRPDLWDPRFLDYDYIGAPWADGVVGNGGFNIESKKLLDLKLALPVTDARRIASDYWVCRNHRAKFEAAGVRFAPSDLALKFSTEFLGNSQPSFGFHGRTCCPHKYADGWNTIESEEHFLRPVPPRMTGRICITTTFDRNYIHGGHTLFKSIRRHTDCSGIDFKVITADPEVVKEFGAENCHIVTAEIKSRYKNVKYSKDLPPGKYAPSWYRYEMFSFKGYDRVICIDSDCICIEDISYLFSEELNQHDLISVEDHIVSKCFTKLVPELEAQGLNFRRLRQRMQEGKIDVQPALLVANKCVVNEAWYSRLLAYANATDFTYSIDEGILNDFIYLDDLRIKLLPLEWDYQDLYEIHCPDLRVPSKPVIVHCQESKPFSKDRATLDPRMHKWHDRWWNESSFGEAKTIVVVIVWNRFENLNRWIHCWKQCDPAGATLVVVHNLESDNARYGKLCRDNDIKYVSRENVGFDLGAFQDVCKERLAGFPKNWDNLIWIADDCIPMQKDFVAQYLTKLQEGCIPCYEISDEVKRHVRTTGFTVTKEISKRLIFPRDPMRDREDCYIFEHKGFNMHEQLTRLGLNPCMVTSNLKDSPLWDTGQRAHLQLMPKHKQVFSIMPTHTLPATTVQMQHASTGVLDNLAIKYKADKSSLYHNFAAKYDRLLSEFRESFTSVLEIGVAQGQSLRMWADYFPNATIHGADISAASQSCEAYSTRIKFHLTDQNNLSQLKNLEQFSPFDLIVDDGNHFWREQICSFETLFPFLRKGGIYIVEDITTSFWPEYKNNAISCMDYLKGLVDELNLKGARGRVPANPSKDFTDWEKGWHRREDCHTNLPPFEEIRFLNGLVVVIKR